MQGISINNISKSITLCKTFVENLWEGDITKPTKKFDKCGLFSTWDGTGKVILPSLTFDNASHFFSAVKPPFFKDYDIIIY